MDDGIIDHFVLFTYSAPKLSIVTSSNHSPFTVLAQGSSHEVKCSDECLAIAGVQSVLWRFAHGDNEDVSIVAIERKVSIVNY